MSNQRINNTPERGVQNAPSSSGFLGGMNFDAEMLTAIGIALFSFAKPKGGRWF